MVYTTPTLLALIIVAILFYSPYAAVNGSSSRKHPKCTQLWVYTEPVQKGPCIVFKHPSGHELEKANRANIEFNKGVESGPLRTLTFNSTNQLKCPSGYTKEFCSGWKSATNFTLQQLTASHNKAIQALGNSTSSIDEGRCVGAFCQVQAQNRLSNTYMVNVTKCLDNYKMVRCGVDPGLPEPERCIDHWQVVDCCSRIYDGMPDLCRED